LNLYYNRARYLDTAEGRFITPDNLEGDPDSPESLHRYLYAGSAPINRVDPSGNDFDLASTLTAVTLDTITVSALSSFNVGVAFALVRGQYGAAVIERGLEGTLLGGLAANNAWDTYSR
jgi:hypothetical protein